MKAQVRAVGNQLELEARLYEVGRVASDEPTLTRTYRGTEADLRRNVHLFANEVMLQITGKPGAFDTHLVFARRPSMGRKDVQIMDYDGANLRRISNGEGIAMLPTFGPGEIWYSRLTAYAAKQKGDATLARRAWNEFFHGFHRDDEPKYPLQPQRLEGPAVLNPIDDVPWMETNHTAQWCLNAIENLALIGDHLPAMEGRWRDA